MVSVDLRLGDCLEILLTLPAGSVDAVITDPPYGNGSYETDVALPLGFYHSLFNGAGFRTIAIFGYPERLIKTCVQLQRTPDEWVTWHPTNKAAGRSKDYLPKETECIAIFGEMPNVAHLMRKRSPHKFSSKITKSRGLSTLLARLGDVWEDASPGMAFNYFLRQHPNEKPLSLMTKLVTLCSNPGDTILDFAMGSGTTGVACVQLERNFIGIEIDETYYKIAEKRIKEAQLQIPMELNA